MEKISNGPGRPKQDDIKVHPPKIKIYQSTIEKLKTISEETGKSQSHLYQLACDEFILKYHRNKNNLIIRL